MKGSHLWAFFDLSSLFSIHFAHVNSSVPTVTSGHIENNEQNTRTDTGTFTINIPRGISPVAAFKRTNQ